MLVWIPSYVLCFQGLCTEAKPAKNSCRHHWTDLFYRNLEDQGKESKTEHLPKVTGTEKNCVPFKLIVKISNNIKPKSPNQNLWMMTEEMSAAVSMWKQPKPIKASGWQTAVRLEIHLVASQPAWMLQKSGSATALAPIFAQHQYSWCVGVALHGWQCAGMLLPVALQCK